MGNAASAVCCCIVASGVVIVGTLLANLDLDFTQEQWDSAHNAGTIEENESALASLGTDLKKTADSALPKNVARAAYIACNTYTRPDYSLGVGPMNDAITVAHYMKENGYTVYFIHNPTSTQFTKYLKHMVENSTSRLLVYYTGHGASVTDTNKDEADGKDEALVFEDKFVIDDELAKLIKGAAKPASSKVIFLNDCCHSGSIWDLAPGQGFAPGYLCLSAARDSETAKQTSMEGTDQGIFTFYFYKLLSGSPELTPTEMETKIAPYLKKYDQVFTKSGTDEALFTQKIFQ
jgi:hypothetical protein